MKEDVCIMGNEKRAETVVGELQILPRYPANRS